MLKYIQHRHIVCIVLCVSLLWHGCKPDNGALKIYFTGDLLLDRGVREQIDKEGVAALFTGVRPLFADADAVVANLECPVTKVHAPINKRYIFRAEPEYLPEIKKAGITHLVMANNHTYDQGRAGLRDTYDNLIHSQLVPVGYGGNQDDACKPVIIQKGAIKVALFSSVLLTLEGWPYLPDSSGVCQATVDELAARIKAFRKANDPCKVVVILHWGAEFQESPTPQQRVQAQQLADAGADAIIGHHPHVIQSKTVYKGKPVFYSLGNFIFDQNYPAAKKGLLVKLTFSKDAIAFSSQTLDINNCSPRPEHNW
jgi:poly-gamma-glutamate capsule biosynthesis protein CapA/YwtB (metallophosphatase superfamily)